MMAPSAWRRISIEKKYIVLWSNAGASADAPALHFLGWVLKTNSLSQSLPAFTAPSGREPLARPQTMCLNLKLCHYAKGPISEGAVERMRDWGSFLEGEGTDYVLRPLF